MRDAPNFRRPSGRRIARARLARLGLRAESLRGASVTEARRGWGVSFRDLRILFCMANGHVTPTQLMAVVGRAARSACLARVRTALAHASVAVALRRLLGTPGHQVWLGLRAKTLVKRMIAAGGRNPEGNPARYVNTVRYRFHNVRGLSDWAFRGNYLDRANATSDVLVLAETNCPGGSEERAWARDWKQGVAFWANDAAGRRCRGMAVMLSKRLPGVTSARRVIADDGGRFVGVRLHLYGRDTLVLGWC